MSNALVLIVIFLQNFNCFQIYIFMTLRINSGII